MAALLSGWTRADGGHCVDEILSLADVLGIARTTRCTVPSDPDSVARLDAMLSFAWQTEPFALLHLFPRNPYKQWGLDAWQAVIESLAGRLPVVVISSPDSRELAYGVELASRLPPGAVEVLAGKTSLADAVRLLRACRLYVGLDTALTHLAAAVGAPTVALYGPPIGRRYFPYHENLLEEGVEVVAAGVEKSGAVVVLRGACDCTALPTRCERTPVQPSECMRSIRPERVIAAVDEVLGRARRGAAAHFTT
jgi:heptosyltransferase III